MAENAAHVTSAISASLPSIFEVLAQDSLMGSVRPALKHAVKVLAENRPEKFGFLLRWYDEIYTGLDFILQNYYLHKYSASFAENFYGLRRYANGNAQTKNLSRKAHWKSLVCLVILPYLKLKLDHWFEETRHNLNTGQLPKRQAMKRLYRVFVAVYPYIHMSWEGSMLAYQVAYMFGKTSWHSPLLHLSGTRLSHDEEEEEESDRLSFSDQWSSSSLPGKLNLTTRKALSVTAVTLSTGLSVGVFFLQFLEWWYASDNNTPSLMALPVPDPPKTDRDLIKTSHDVCPLCLKVRTNHTALSTSGFVFCYPCIYDYIKQHRCCPVTSYPSRQEHLIKLYPPES
ncbi:peroxisome assembly protein 12-like [Saccostrea cucullata]|uniref:peroxisome assembly protein 12-like n=1 Tax=Saccostrea cuccullata TaxID=36930 RepID=UPI002ED0E689